jgi:hypothetical protein
VRALKNQAAALLASAATLYAGVPRGLTPEMGSWLEARVAEWAGSSAVVTRVESVPSRVAAVWRVDATGAPTLYLKQFAPEEPRHASTIAEHVDRLRSIESVIARDARLAPYRVVAFDERLRLILSVVVEGVPIASLHRRLMFSSDARRRAVASWHDVGRWLAVLHGSARRHDADISEMVRYVVERFDAWGDVDPRFAALAHESSAATRCEGDALLSAGAYVTLCHGDVSSRNIIVGARTGVIDLDDLRWDLPGIDLSQALLESAQFARVGSLVPVWGLAERFAAAVRDGYGDGWPEGAAFRLAHLRNLAVFGLTLALRLHSERTLSRITTTAHYLAVIAEIRRMIAFRGD